MRHSIESYASLGQPRDAVDASTIEVLEEMLGMAKHRLGMAPSVRITARDDGDPAEVVGVVIAASGEDAKRLLEFSEELSLQP